jgi:raffinose/stachyose/melibiose transport system permease protein
MAKNNDNQVSAVRRAKHGGLLTAFFCILAVLYVYPIFLVLINAVKKKGFIMKAPFSLPNKQSYAGMQNFISGIEKTNFFAAVGNSVIITVGSVLVILICTSMCAWYITRVQNKLTKTIYMLCLFSMIVPFQMVMFSLSKLANMMHLSNPIGIILVYLGFGAGLAVFMFCGFVKSIPLEIEEAAMIDGCTPIQTFFQVVFPIMKSTTITVAILQAMWIWNDYLLPYLVLDLKKYKTIPIVIQYLKGGYGAVDWGTMMAMLVLAIIPIVIFYAICQKYIIEGVVAGAVKG